MHCARGCAPLPKEASREKQKREEAEEAVLGYLAYALEASRIEHKQKELMGRATAATDAAAVEAAAPRELEDKQPSDATSEATMELIDTPCAHSTPSSASTAPAS